MNPSKPGGVDPATLIADPHWHLHAVSRDLAQLGFVRLSERDLREAPFLDERLKPFIEARANLAYTAAQQAGAIAAAPPVFIFHTAFCCSTLIARALDRRGICLALKEPRALMDLANARRLPSAGLAPDTFPSRITLVTSLLARPLTAGERVLLKPTNTVNNILAELLEAHSDSRALLVHSDLEGFLISILKKGEPGRAFARQLFAIFRLDHPLLRDIDGRAALKLTDLQAAVFAWLAQIDYFRQAIARFGERVRSLHADDFLARPGDTLRAAARFFSLDHDESTIDEVLEGPLLRRDSKNAGRGYGADDRERERQQVVARHGEEIAFILEWARRLRPEAGWRRLERPLLKCPD